MSEAESPLPPELQQAIASSPWTFEMLAEQSIVPIFIVQDDQTRYFNPACEALTGYPRAELGKLNFWDLTPAGMQPALFEWGRQLQSGAVGPQRIESCFVDRSGQTRWFDLTGWPIVYDRRPALAAMAVEITARKQAEQALRASEERFRALVENIPGVIYRCRADGSHAVEFISESIEALCGFAAAEFLGPPHRTCLELVHEDDRPRVEAIVRDAVAAGQPFVVQCRMRHRDGRMRHVVIRARPVCDEHGHVRWLDGVLLDMTHVTDLERQLRQAERLAIIGQTITDVTHHVKNITNTLRGSGWLLSNALAARDLDAVHNMWRVFQRNIERLAQLVEEMLSYTRLPELHLTEVSLEALLRELHEDCLAMASTRYIALRLELPPDMPPVRCDRDALNDIMLNLVCNGLDACEEIVGGQVTIAAAWDAASRTVRLTVSDTGCGIEESIRGEIFNPFFSTKGSKGNGLGLTIVQKLVHEHGGTIEFQSERGQTRFTVILPQP